MKIMYDVKSERAEEFISDAEIRETMAYAEAHKDDRPLIVSILEKARLCKGLTHREAAVLLASGQQDLTEEMFALARDIKQRFYGNRIVMFAPLYLSNYCVNGCVYCPYHAKNKTIRRRKLTQEEIRREVIALQDMGTSGWLWRPARTRVTTRLNMCWRASVRFTASSIRTEPSGA